MRTMITSKKQHMPGLRLLLIMAIIITIILLSSFISGAQLQEDAEQAETAQDDMVYYLRLPVTLIILLIWMVGLLLYARKER